MEVKSIALEHIPLAKIVSNTAQSRGMGVLSRLQLLGHGLFEQSSLDSTKRPLWPLLLSDKAEDRKEATDLIAAHEPSIAGLWEKLSGGFGQLEPVGLLKDPLAPPTNEEYTYDVIFGMRRVVALAYGHALAPAVGDNAAPPTVEAKVYEGEFTAVELKLMALEENDDREDESPIDKAITYQFLKKQGKLSPAEIAKKLGRSAQHVKDYLNLLDPLLEDRRQAIHFREYSVDAAVKLLRKRKGGDGSGDHRESNGSGKDRCRVQSAKTLIRLLEAKKKPKDMPSKEWGYLTDPKVREYLSYKCGVKFRAFEDIVPAKPAADPADPNTTTVKIKRKQAVQLLISIGCVNAGQWEDDLLKAKLESVVNLVEDGQKAEKPELQKLLDKLLAAYATGLIVEITE